MGGKIRYILSEVFLMCNNGCFGGNNCWWIIILVLLFCCCGNGNGSYTNNSCGCC